ncbi:MAG: thymidine phosphorylase, partial [Kiloniellales bacterium]|nr:thymidine phosphorylase [Kiloniellales bacterium]
YAIRDVTATVESIPLITASILSKKLAAGLEALVMDVKVGNGAFMESVADATALARSIVTVANTAGLKTSALVTDMNQVLGRTAGNALEVVESLNLLSGKSADARLLSVTEALCSELLVMGGLEEDETAAKTHVRSVLESGKAAEAFDRMSAALGGPGDIVTNCEKYLPKAVIQRPVFATSSGYVSRIDTRGIGLAVISLGGGRTRADQKIDHSVGFSQVAALGDEADGETPLAIVHAGSDEFADMAVERIGRCFEIQEGRPPISPIVIERITGS